MISVPEITLVTTSPEEMLETVHIVPTSGMDSGVTCGAKVNVVSPFERLRSPEVPISNADTPPSTSR